MSFFKKLFNRITGKKDESPAAAAETPVALPAPEPAEETVPVAVAVVEERVPVAAKVKPAAKEKAGAKAPPPPPPKKAASKAKPEPVKKPAVKATAKKKAEAPSAKTSTAKPKADTKPIAKPAPLREPVAVKAARPDPVAPTPPPAVEVPAAPVALAEPPLSPPPVKAEEISEPAPRGWFSRLKTGLSKSSKSITGSITAIFTKRKLDAATLQDLEDTLIQADLGIAVSERIIKAVSHGRYDKEIDPEEVKQILAAEVAAVLQPVEVPFSFGMEKPYVILVVGVNGSGKTTTIGKLGAIAAREGFKVKFAACDTFRAAAIEQLTVWGKRIGAETISRPPGSDAAGLAFDAMKAAQADGTDILFIDTAGRLHNKTYLMDELDKVVRVIKKYDEKAPHAVLLVLDATTGQNALAQAEAFTKVAGVTGLIMTKLDGTARGGILVAIAEKFKLPIHAIGVGESIDDLQPFDAKGFARAIAGLETERDEAA